MRLPGGLIGLDFKNKLLAYSLFLSVIPLLLLGTIASREAMQNINEEVNHNHQIILKQIEQPFDQFIMNLEALSVQLAMDPSITDSLLQGPSPEQYDSKVAMLDTIAR